MEPTKKSKPNKLVGEKKYLKIYERILKPLLLFDKKAELNLEPGFFIK